MPNTEPEYRKGYKHATWSDVQDGQTVWIDNYQDGEFPQASPLISGPYRVVSVQRRMLQAPSSQRRRTARLFTYYPNNLLVQES